ncbi:MAG: Stage V sporulation protein S [Thermotoga sp. 50_1627]|nr:MAG: Stage V sporulation protein S [Thermotoga sp. 50_64]KUK24371.1 MAG: Stage V sporulation protein S [Thermotoga sp. 50_1627]MDK2924134.1 stage sporulation protein [Pseudothermotoga sp.]HCO97682.1 stage V sporulation protein S [Pseudothermotoga sp.]
MVAGSSPARRASVPSVKATLSTTMVTMAVEKEVEMMEVLKVASNSNPNKVAGALAGMIREHGRAELQAIGAGAVNQAVKAIAIARGYLAPSGIDLVSIPAFTDVEIDKETRTAIKFIVFPRS